MFKTNESTLDRIIRVIAGLGLLAFSVTSLVGILQIVVVVISVALLGTGIVGFCGIYTLFGINTCPIKNKKK